MRRFLSASCCAIVVLQILIGVPLIVCTAYFSVVSGQWSPVAAENGLIDAQPVAANYACPDQIGGKPVEVDCARTDALPMVTAGLEPILEARLEQGSPLAASSLASNSPAESLRQFATALEEVAATASELPPIAPTGIEPASSSGEHLADAPDRGASKVDDRVSLIPTLRVAVASLYAKAETLEGDGRFERADQIRELARDLRAEIDRTQDEAHSLETSPGTGLQPTVTEAAYNPQPAPKTAPSIPPPPVPSEPPPESLLPSLPDLFSRPDLPNSLP